jgi:DNA polymerase-3 subunit alpha
MTVELDRRQGEDTPRVTVKRFQPLDGLAKRTRLRLNLSVAEAAMIPVVARELRDALGGNGSVRMTLPLPDGREATMLIGRDFALDADLAARLGRILGEGAVTLSAQEPPRLALVG